MYFLLQTLFLSSPTKPETAMLTVLADDDSFVLHTHATAAYYGLRWAL